jgi:signal transduction histidine kinase
MWFATGVGLFSRRDDRTERHRLPGLDPDTLVGSVAATANGDLWAVAEGQVYRRAHGENGWTRVAAEPGIDAVFGDAPEGGVWMGGDGGLFLWRGGSISRVWRGPDAAHRPVSLLVEPDGTAWVGTFAAGLLRYRSGEATLFGRAAGLPDLAIASVLDDGHGFFWLATHAGLVRVSKARLSSATDTTWLDPIAYTVRDGLRSHYTDERGQPAGVVTPDGHLWFGTTRGIVEIDPSRLPDRPRANGVYIDGVWADGRLLEADRVVPPGRGSLQFRFATAAHVSSSHVRFRYRLEGFDTGWTEVGGARDASYTNVPPGTYRFVVGAADETPDWGPDEMSVTLVLSPHWYQAWWVRGVATAGVLGLVVTLPLVRARKARRAAESLARIVDARTADLRGEVDERRRAEDDLRASEARYRTLAGELEDRVRDRTAALEAEVAERKRYEQELIVARDAAESGARAKSAFLASMSHELRTPLNAVIGYTEMLQEEAAQRGLASFEPDLARIRGAGQHLLALVSEVLDLARIEAGRVSLTPETFEVRELVTEVVDSVATTARRHGNSVHVDIEPGVDVMTADVLRLKQVLLNLLSNACKFTKDGAVTIEVRRSNEGNAAWTSFVVRDTGIGIAAEHLPRLFVEFTQVHGRGSVHEGAGLGLAISRRLCLLMAGTIEVASELGTGTAFTVRLPTRARVAESVVD